MTFQSIFDRIFREDETLSPRLLVGAALAAWVMIAISPHIGAIRHLLYLLVIVAMALVTYGVMRLALPRTDTRDPDGDPLAAWGVLILLVVIGWEVFGIAFVIGGVLGAGLVWWRMPELLPFLPDPEEAVNRTRTRR